MAGRLTLSTRALRLLSLGKRQALAVQSATAETLSDSIPARFGPLAYSLGYSSAAKYDVFAARRNLPATYLERKKRYYGSSEPLVKSGNMRLRVFSTLRLESTDDKIFVKIGKLRAGPNAAPPPRQAVLVFSRFDPSEIESVRERTKEKLKFIVESEGQLQLQPNFPVSSARLFVDSVVNRMTAIRIAREARWQRWRETPGGSAPILSTGARSAAERQRDYYYRYRTIILLRKRMRYKYK